MLYNKFVVVSESFNKAGATAIIRCQPCECHFELVHDNEKCFGGGRFIENANKKELMFHSKSIDYGEPDFLGWDKLVLDSKYKDWNIVYVRNIEDYAHAIRIDITKKITFE